MMQHTIKKEILISGIGLHCGKEVSAKFKPAVAGSGIVFIRTDLPRNPRIKADLSNVTTTVRGTNLGGVHTVEHVLSALYGLSITNVEIELNNAEPPALDGSSKQYCDIFKKSGIVAQRYKLRRIKVKEPIILCNDSQSIMALPSDSFTVSFMIHYPAGFIGSQYYRFDFDKKNYLKDIAPARTYGFLEELETLKKQGLALGANFDNAIAIDKDKYITKLRFKDEIVRHKILDLIGDLSLLGAEIKANVICIRSGHALNIALAKKIKEVG